MSRLVVNPKELRNPLTPFSRKSAITVAMLESPTSDPNETVEAPEEATKKRLRPGAHVVNCDGTQALVSTLAIPGTELAAFWSVGQLISIQSGGNRVVGLIYKLTSDTEGWDPTKPNPITLHVELAGEVRELENGAQKFSSGISVYPSLGSPAHKIRKEDLQTIYKSSDASAVTVGSLSQARDIPAVVSVNALLSRHFAVVGTTGTGKSTSVSIILHLIAQAAKDQRILILDPHNEYTSAFGAKAHTITAETLDLPFWMLTLEEFSQVVFRGREESAEELDALREFIPKAKHVYKEGKQGSIRRERHGNSITADTPVPYRIADLLGLLEEEIGSLDGALRRLTLRRLKARLESSINDPRFGFLFSAHNAKDRIAEVLSEVYRVPMNGKPITVFQMSGIPSEVVNSVASVLCRLAFDMALASDSKVKTLVVCEEAHRYIPADTSSGFAPTRASIARIAKEGRKYGVSIAIITQRPDELDPTILSQCNTVFAMRLGNDADQDVMRKAISNGSRSSIAFLSSLADRECIAFGSAVSTPMRMMFRTLAQSARPSSAHVSDDRPGQGGGITVEEIVRTLRGSKDGHEIDDEENGDDDWVVQAESQPVAEEDALSKIRSSLIKKQA